VAKKIKKTLKTSKNVTRANN